MKTKIIAIAVAAVLVIAAVVTTVVILNTAYLDGMKDYSPAHGSVTFNGVEIVEDDGLFYLTREGKKLSKTGYTSLVDVNTYYNVNNDVLLEADDFEIYDYFVARKPEANTYFLVNTEGEELVIEGENLVHISADLPYLYFADNVNEKMGAVSLKALSSDLSTATEEAITLKMFDSVNAKAVNNDDMQASVLEAKNSDVDVVSPKYIYFDASGKQLFTSPMDYADDYSVYDDDGNRTLYFLTYDNNLYTIDGTLVVADASYRGATESAEAGSNKYILFYVDPEDENATAEVNAAKRYVKVISATTSFELKAESYVIDDLAIGTYGNLLTVADKEGKVQIYNAVTGAASAKYATAVYNGDYIVATTSDATPLYLYIDTETGSTLIQSTDANLKDLKNGMFMSEEENKNLSEGTSIVRFVKAGQSEKAYTLGKGQSITKVIKVNKAISVYEVTTENKDVADYTVKTKKIIVPFAGAESASYDEIEYLEVFNDAAQLAVGIDYTNGKYDIIDLATAQVVKSVAAAGADMAKTSIKYVKTVTLVSDFTNKESAVEFAILAVQKIDDSEIVASTDYFAVSRNTAMVEDADAYITKAASVVELGSNFDTTTQFGTFIASNVESDRFSKYLVVATTVNSSDVYTINADLALEKLSSIPFKVTGFEYYGTSMTEVYLDVRNDVNYNGASGYGLYDVNGNCIIAPAFDDVSASGEYIVVQRNNAYGMYKYNAEKGKVKQVLDFEYDNITAIGDDGFLVRVGYDYYIYEGDDQLKSDRLTGFEDDSPYDYVNFFTNYAINEETGKVECNLGFYVFIGGKAYAHRAEAEELVNYYEFVAESTAKFATTTVNSRVTVINFRNTDGSLIETKVIYPTAKSESEFTMNDTGHWYLTGDKDLQSGGVANKEELILAMQSGDSDYTGIVNLYKAHAADAGLAG